MVLRRKEKTGVFLGRECGGHILSLFVVGACYCAACAADVSETFTGSSNTSQTVALIVFGQRTMQK